MVLFASGLLVGETKPGYRLWISRFLLAQLPLMLAQVTLCEGYRDGAEKAKGIRWQAQEEIQDRDPKDGSACGKKKKIPQASANFGRQGLGCLSRGRRHRQRHRPAAQ